MEIDSAELKKRFDTALALISEQAENQGIWFVAQTAPEAYLQQELRRLHEVIEGKSQEQCGREALVKVFDIKEVEGRPDLKSAEQALLAEFRIENVEKLLGEVGLYRFANQLRDRVYRATRLIIYYNMLKDRIDG